MHNGLVEMRGTTAPRLLLELICARMLLPGADDSTGGLLQRLERMERRLTLGGTDAPPAAAGSAPTSPPRGTPTASRPGPGCRRPDPANAPTSAPPWAVDPAASPTRAPLPPRLLRPAAGTCLAPLPTSGAPASYASAADSPIPASPARRPGRHR